jgi:lipooligosaccharide transport system permease protein
MLRRTVERELRVYRGVWHASVFTSFIGPSLFLAAMGLGLGELVDERSGTVDGLTYLAFVTPGLLAAVAAQAGAGEGLWPVMAGTKWMRFYHGMAATPLRPLDIYGGLLVWVAIRVLLMAVVFTVVAGLFGGLVSWWAPLAIPAAMLCGVAFTAPLAAYTATRETDLSFSLIMRLIVQPLFLFSGTFFPISQLPDWLEPFVVLSPLYHGVELCRSATTGSAELIATLLHIGYLAAIIVVATFVGRYTYGQKLSA